MLKVRNKFVLIGLVGIALALILVWPITCLHLVTDFVWWQIALIYIVLTLPALIGLLLIMNVWGTFEMKKEAQEKQ